MARPEFRNLLPCVLAVVLMSIAAACAYGDVLFRDGNEVTLQPSMRYVAIHLHPGVDARDPRLEETVKPAALVKDALILNQHRLAVVRLPTDSAASVAAMKAKLTVFGQVVPVYARAGTDVVLTNQVIFKPKPVAARTVIAGLANWGTVEPLNDRGTYLLNLNDPTRSLEVSNALNLRTAEVDYAEPNFVVIGNASPTPP